jgi:hypothetical protein
METISEITQAEADRRDRARRYESALNLRVSSQTAITRCQERSEAYAKQVTILTAMLEQAAAIDGAIDVTVMQLGATIAGSVRGHVVALFTKALADQQRRSDDAQKNLATAKSELQRAERLIADLS